MKKLIEFYPCPRCNQNLFRILETPVQKKLVLATKSSRKWFEGKIVFRCRKCYYRMIEFEEDPYESYPDKFIEVVELFIKNNPEKIDKKFKEIWKRFLKQEIKGRFKEINAQK